MASHVILKRRSDDIDRIKALTATLARRFRNVFLSYITEATSDDSIKTIRQFLEDGRADLALSFMAQFTNRFPDAVAMAFREAALFEIANSTPAAVRAARQAAAGIVPAVAVAFDPGNPRAERYARQHSAKLVAEIGDSTRAVVQTIIAEGQRTGAHPLAMAREIKASVGLTERQYAAVKNYERLLRAGSKEALDRDLRDRRSDRTVARAADKPLSEAQIKRMVEHYRRQYIAYRTDVIARTEAGQALSAGRAEGMRQTLEQTGLNAQDHVEKTWQTIPDKRRRDTHAVMQGQTVTGVDTPYKLPRGGTIMRPCDPNAPAGETIQCRCTETYRILSPATRRAPSPFVAEAV